jgi:succinate dehydrogenase hydrophobic anchor subunit
MNGKTGKGSAYGWLLQRITGIFLAFFLILHIQALHFTKDWSIDFSLVTQRLQSTGWVIFYVIFVPALLFHGFQSGNRQRDQSPVLDSGDRHLRLGVLSDSYV